MSNDKSWKPNNELFCDWFEREKAAAKKEKTTDKQKLAKDGASRYYTNSKVRAKIDRLLEHRTSLWANFEHKLEDYSDAQKKTAAEKENRRILKEIGAINHQIKKIDAKFYSQIEIDDNI